MEIYELCIGRYFQNLWFEGDTSVTIKESLFLIRNAVQFDKFSASVLRVEVLLRHWHIFNKPCGVLSQKSVSFASRVDYTPVSPHNPFYFISYRHTLHKQKDKTSPGQAYGVKEVVAPRISRQSANESGKVVSHTHWPLLPPWKIPGTHFC
jgi:hypothetical protein